MRCPRCGTEVNEHEKFCGQCGFPITQSNHMQSRQNVPGNDRMQSRQHAPGNENPQSRQNMPGPNNAQNWQNMSNPQPERNGFLRPLFLVPAISVVLSLTVILLCVFVFPIEEDVKKQVQVQLDLGNQYVQEQNYEAAVVAFNEALKLDEDSEEAALGLAEVYTEQDDQQAAIEALNRASEMNIDPESDNYSRLEELAQRNDAEIIPVSPGETSVGTTTVIQIVQVHTDSTPAPETEQGSEHTDAEGTEIPPVEETADAEVLPAEETSDAELPPVEETTDAEIPPVEEIADAEILPAEETSDAELPPVEETMDAEIPPVEEIADAEILPAEETADAELPPVEETADAEILPAEEAMESESSWDEVSEGNSEEESDQEDFPESETAGEAEWEEFPESETAGEAEWEEFPEPETVGESEWEESAEPAMAEETEWEVFPGAETEEAELPDSESTDATEGGDTESGLTEETGVEEEAEEQSSEMILTEYQNTLLAADLSTAEMEISSVGTWNRTLDSVIYDFHADGDPELVAFSVKNGCLAFDLYKVEGGQTVQKSSAQAASGFGSVLWDYSYSGTQDLFVSDNRIGIVTYYANLDDGNGIPTLKTVLDLYQVQQDGTIFTLIEKAVFEKGTSADEFAAKLSEQGFSASWIYEISGALSGMGLEENPYQDLTVISNPLSAGLKEKEQNVEDWIRADAWAAAATGMLSISFSSSDR